MEQLVLGRECGDCNVCCSFYSIDQPELTKPAYTLCPNWSPGGHCAIYDSRPMPCRTFYCLWRMNAGLDDWWRPDRCGVAIRVVAENVPPEFAGRRGLCFDLVGSHAVIEDDRFIQAVAGQIAGGVPVMLLVRGKRGSARVFLNERMARAVAAHDRAALVAELRQAVADAVAVAP